MICPNITSPEWKALVAKVGENRAWREFLIYGKIPSADNYEVKNGTEENSEPVVFRSIRTKSTEQIAAGINKDLIRSKNQLKYTSYLMASVINTLGDISPNRKLDVKPADAFRTVKGVYTSVVDNLATLLNGVITSEEDYQNMKSSPDYDTLVREEFPMLAYVNSYEDMVNAIEAYNDIVSNFDKFQELVIAELAHKGIRMGKNSVQVIDANDVAVQETDDTDDTEISQDEIGERYDRSVFETNPRDTASVRVKALVQTIKTGKFEMGIPIYADPNDVFADILQAGSEMALTGYTEANSKYEVFKAALIQRVAARPYLNDLLDKMAEFKDKGQWEKINDILTFATKAFAQETLMLYKTRKDGNQVTGITDVKVINSNRDSVEDQVAREWLEAHKQSGFYSRSATGELKPKAEKIEKLGKILEESKTLPAAKKVEKFKEFFAVLGIQFTNKDMEYIAPRIAKKLRKRDLDILFNKNNVLSNIYDSYVKNADVVFEDNYGFQDEKSSMKALAGLYYEANPGRFNITSSRTADGKQKYLYIQTSFLEKRKRQWETGETASVTNGALARPNKSFWDKVKQGVYTFVPQYFNGIREQQAGKDGKVRKSLTDKEQAVTMMLKHQENLNVATYINFTLSDKTTTMETKMTKEFFMDSDSNPLGRDMDFSVTEDGSIAYTPALKDKIYNNLAEPEISRILSAIKYSKDVNLENYETASRLFYIVPVLNADERLTQFRADLYAGQKTMEQLKAEYGDIVAQVILDNMTESAEEQIEGFIGNGIIKVNEQGNYTFPTSISGGSNKAYLTRLFSTGVKQRNLARLMMMDMKLNYMNTQVKMLQFLRFDPALAYKTFKGFNKGQQFSEISGADKMKLASSTWDEFSKRAAALIAPGGQGNYSWTLKDGTPYFSPSYNAVTAADVIYDINGTENTITDGQEYITVQEHIDNLMSEGKIPLEIWESIYNKIQKEGPGGYYKLSKEEMGYVFTPTKPVQANDVNEGPAQAGLNRIDYVKTSRYPLLPQHEAGSERDKLRQWMERNNVQSLNFGSGKKLGRPAKSVQFFTDNGKTFVEPAADEWNEAVQALSRDGLRTQQEIPHQKDEIRVVSQMNRTLFDGMLNETFSLKGIKEMSGVAAKGLKEAVRERLFNIAADKLQKELGDLNRSHRGLHRLLKQAILEDTTGSYGENDLKSIEIDEKTGKFKYQLEFQFKAKKYQGLINSLINKNVMLKVEGSSFIQVSGVGAKYNFSSLSAGIKNDIVWTDSYAKTFKNGNATLNYISKKDGEVKPAQVIVSQYIRDNDGNLVDLSKYITEKNRVKILDTSKFPKELFELVGTRIPNQSHPSMLPIEVVGFLPSYMENTIIVPDGITGQMGADFDVDKLYAYLSKFKYNEATTTERLGADQDEYNELVTEAKKKAEAAGEQADSKGRFANFNQYLAEAVKDKYGDGPVPKFKIEKPASMELVKYVLNKPEDVESMNEEQLGQLYRDIHWMALTHPAAYDKITKSVDMPEVKEKVAEREELLEKYGIAATKTAMLPLDFMTSINRFNDNRSGKVGVGVYANLISAQADFQDKIIRLGFTDADGNTQEKPIRIRLSKRSKKVIDLVNIGQLGTSTSYIKDENGKLKPVERSISDTLNMMFTEAVDNAKNQFLREFNWDDKAMSATGAFSMLTDADGNAAPIQFIMDLTSQAAIKDLFTLIDNKKDSFGEFDSNAMETAMLELHRKIADNLVEQGQFDTLEQAQEYLQDEKRDQTLDPETLAEMWLVGKANELAPERRNVVLAQIAKDYGYASVKELQLKYETVQYDSLNLFKRIEDIGRELQTILGSVYLYTKGIGSNVFITKQKTNQLNKLAGSGNFLGLSNIAGPVAKNEDTGKMEIQPRGEIGAAINKSLIVAQSMYDSLFPISSGKTIETIVDTLLENQGKNKETLGREAYVNVYDTVFNGIKAYMFTMPELELFINSRQERDRLINGDSSIGKRIMELTKDQDFKRNGFLKNIEVKQAPKQDAFTINFKAPFGTDLDEKAIISGFYELATSDKEEVRQLAKDLAIYPFLTGDGGNIGRFIPVDYLMSDEDFTKMIGSMDYAYGMNMSEPGAMENLMTQMIQNNPEEFAKSYKYSTYEDGQGAKDNVFKRVLKKLVGNAADLSKVDTFTIKVGDFKKDTNGNNIAESLMVPLSEREAALLKGQGVDTTKVNFKYPPYILINDTFTSEFFDGMSRNVNYLYKRVSEVGDPAGRYERINILGYNGIKEYDFNNPELTSAIKNNNNVEDDPAFQEVAPPAAAVEQPAEQTTKLKTYTGKIESLEPNQVFVFGSNPEGRHGAGAAKLAHDKFGAFNNNGRGLQLTGKSYALVTKNLTPGYTEKRTGIVYEKAGERSVSPEQIKTNIQELYETAKQNPDKEFVVAYSATGKNLNGYSAQEMADMFSSAEIPANMVFEEGFSKLLKKATQPVDEKAEADKLPPIEQNFTDGQGGRKMQPQFAGKSTMDLILSGDRTRTTRANTDVNRMIKDYGLSKIEDLVGKVIRMTDKKGRVAYTRIAKVSPFTQEYQDQTWQKEGWEKSVTDKNVGNYPYAIEFELLDKPATEQSTPTKVEISSNAKGLAAALTNPTELAKQKGNLQQSYPVTFDGVTYKDAEEAYQKNKGKFKPEGTGKGSTYDLMLQILEAKLKQYPRLVEEITKAGGTAWLGNATHQPTNKNTVWETGGKNWFINALQEAYYNVLEDQQMLSQDEEIPSTVVTVKAGEFIVEDNNGVLSMWYAKKDGSKGAELNNPSIRTQVEISYRIEKDPSSKVSVKIGPNELSYYLSPDNRVYSLQPSSYGNEIVDPNVIFKVRYAAIAEEELGSTETETPTEQNVPGEKRIVVPEGSNPENMVIFEDENNKYLMNDGQQEAYNFIKSSVQQLMKTRKKGLPAEALDNTVTFNDPLTQKFNDIIPQDMWSNMIGLAGRGGVGKTTVIKAIMEAIEGENRYARPYVMYLAPTHTAATVLQESLGLDSEKANDGTVNTTASHVRRNNPVGNTLQLASEFDYIQSTKFKPAFGKPDVIIIDESSMIGAQDIKDMVARMKIDLQKGFIDRLPIFIFMGDYRQLGPINEQQNKFVNKGIISSTLLLNKEKSKELTQVMRSDDKQMHKIFDAVGNEIVSNINRTQANEQPKTLSFDNYDKLTNESTAKMLVVNNVEGVIEDYADYLATNNNPYGMFWVHYNRVENPKTIQLAEKIRRAYFNRAGLTINDKSYRKFSKGDYIEFTGSLEMNGHSVKYDAPDQAMQKLLEDRKISKDNNGKNIIGSAVIKPRARFKVLDIVEKNELLINIVPGVIERQLNDKNVRVDVEEFVLYNRQNKIRGLRKVTGLKIDLGAYNAKTKMQENIKISKADGTVLAKFNLNYGDFKNNKEALENLSEKPMPFVPSYIGSSHTAQGNSIKNVIVGDYNVKENRVNSEINQDDIFSSMYTGLTRTSGSLVIIKPAGASIVNNQDVYEGAITDNKDTKKPTSSLLPSSPETSSLVEKEEEEFDPMQLQIDARKETGLDAFVQELFDKETTVTDFKSFLNKLHKNATSTHKAIIMAIAKTGGLAPVTFKIDNNQKDMGTYNRTTRTITINPKVAVADAADVEDMRTKLHEVILHELVHHVTVDLLMADPASLKPEQRKWVAALKNLFDQVQNKMLNDPNHADEFIIALTTVTNDGFLSASDKSKYYGLTSIYDFVTMLMTDKSFQDFMNSVEYTGDKSILDRFMDLVISLIKSLGIEVKDNSVLNEGLKNIIGLLDSRNQTDGIQRSIATEQTNRDYLEKNFNTIVKALNIKTNC